jgi:hypothetical protein
MRIIIICFCIFFILFCFCTSWQNIKYTNEDLQLFENGEYPTYNPGVNIITTDNIDTKITMNNTIQENITTSEKENIDQNNSVQYNYGDDVLALINSVKPKKVIDNSVLNNTSNTRENTNIFNFPKEHPEAKETQNHVIIDDSNFSHQKDNLRYLPIQKIVKNYILVNQPGLNQMKIGEQYKILRSFVDTNNQINYLCIGNATVVKIVDKKVGLKVSLFNLNEEIMLKDKIQI